MGRAVVFVNGVIADPARLAHRVQPSDRLIAADGGVHHCLSMGLQPHVVVGDLDSVEPALREQLAQEGVEIEDHPVAKNETDLELALERAVRDGAEEIVLLGALGGRLDQALANVLILAQRVWPVPIRVVEADQVAEVIRGGETLTLEAQPGATVSLLPLSAEVTGIDYTGLLYPLHDAALSFGSTRGISNEVAQRPASIRIRTGLALVVQTMDV